MRTILGFVTLVGWITFSATAQTASSGQSAAGNAPAGGGVPPSQPTAAPRAPNWVPLPPKHAKFLDDVLKYWENRTNQIERFRCQFKRWEYDGTFGPGQSQAKTYAEGQIQYLAPDKGLFKTTKLLAFTRDAKNPQGTYVERPELADHWICDGKSVFKFDYRQKVLVEQVLPPEYRGRAITHGPLPFLFGAQADDIKRRYWLRIITPADRTQGPDREYWIEALPKTREDAADYRAIHLIIDGRDFLPKGMVLFGRAAGSRQTFVFENREVNFNVLAEKLNIFHRQFFEPKLPGSDWKKVVYGVEQARAPR